VTDASARWNQSDLIIGEDARARLDQFATLLARARRAWRAAGAAGLLLKPEAGSAGAVEQAALLASDAGPDGPWRENEAQLPLVVANVFGLAASEHVAALAALFDSGEVIFSTAPLVRAVVEHVSHALWVMDNEIVERPRVARATLELIEGARQSRNTAARLGSPGNHRFAQEHDFQMEQVQRRFWPEEQARDDRGRLVLVGQRLPTMEEAVKRSGEMLSWPTSGVYDYLANASHPTFHTIVSSIKQTPAPQGGMIWHAALDDVGYLEKLVRLANGYLLNLAHAITSYLGHPDAGLAEWRELTDTVLTDEAA